MKYLSIGCFLIALGLTACVNPHTNKDAEHIRKMMKSQEVKRVTDVEILTKAQEIGSEIATKSQQALVKKLMASMADQGVEKSIDYCNEVALPTTDSLSASLQVQVKRTSLKLRNSKNKPDSLEQQLLEAYEYAYSQEQELKESVQLVEGKQSVLFTKPILVKNPACLNCHGKVGETLQADHAQLLKRHYPADSATGYQLHEFRGMWSIKLPTSKVINAL